MIKIFIVDDHAIIRSGARKIFNDVASMTVVGEAATGRDAIDFVEKNAVDIVLLDVALPDMNGIEILKEMKAIKPHVHVLIVSMHSEQTYALRAFRAGASGYITKDRPIPELIEAIKMIMSGQKFINPAIAQQLIFDLGFDSEKPPHEKLSDREFEILCLIASGKTVTQISDELFLSSRTVSTYRSRILAKMEMKNNAELTYYAIKHNLIN